MVNLACSHVKSRHDDSKHQKKHLPISKESAESTYVGCPTPSPWITRRAEAVCVQSFVAKKREVVSRSALQDRVLRMSKKAQVLYPAPTTRSTLLPLPYFMFIIFVAACCSISASGVRALSRSPRQQIVPGGFSG